MQGMSVLFSEPPSGATPTKVEQDSIYFRWSEAFVEFTYFVVDIVPGVKGNVKTKMVTISTEVT